MNPAYSHFYRMIVTHPNQWVIEEMGFEKDVQENPSFKQIYIQSYPSLSVDFSTCLIINIGDVILKS